MTILHSGIGYLYEGDGRHLSVQQVHALREGLADQIASHASLQLHQDVRIGLPLLLPLEAARHPGDHRLENTEVPVFTYSLRIKLI